MPAKNWKRTQRIWIRTSNTTEKKQIKNIKYINKRLKS